MPIDHSDPISTQQGIFLRNFSNTGKHTLLREVNPSFHFHSLLLLNSLMNFEVESHLWTAMFASGVDLGIIILAIVGSVFTLLY